MTISNHLLAGIMAPLTRTGHYFGCAASAAIQRRDAAVNAGLLAHPMGNNVALVSAPPDVPATVLSSEYYGDLPKVVFTEPVPESVTDVADMQRTILLAHFQQIESRVGVGLLTVGRAQVFACPSLTPVGRVTFSFPHRAATPSQLDHPASILDLLDKARQYDAHLPTVTHRSVLIRNANAARELAYTGRFDVAKDMLLPLLVSAC